MAGLKPLAGLKKLERLELDGCRRLSDLGPLAGHPKLSNLNIRSSPNIRSLTALGQMPALGRFYFSPDHQFTAAELAAFKKNNPRCKINPRW
jgi:hypothetical protein